MCMPINEGGESVTDIKHKQGKWCVTGLSNTKDPARHVCQLPSTALLGPTLCQDVAKINQPTEEIWEVFLLAASSQ